MITSIASIKWLKPVNVKQLQLYMKKKLGWIESYTFIKVKKRINFFSKKNLLLFFCFKVFPLLTRFQILYRLNMLELDVADVLSLSDTTIFQPISIKKTRFRQAKQYYEVEWKQHDILSTQTLEDQMNNLSLIVLDDDDDEEEKLITIEPADLFRHAYPDIVNHFEIPLSKIKKTKKITTDDKTMIKKRKPKQCASTSMSLDLLSIIHHDVTETPITKSKICKFNHRPTMAALSTSINIDVLSVLQKSNGNINSLKISKSRPIKHQTRSDMTIQTQKPVTLLNTSISLDVLDIILREKQQLNDDECIIIDKPMKNKEKTDVNIMQLLSSDSTDDEIKDVLPLPLWDRIRQRTAV